MGDDEATGGGVYCVCAVAGQEGVESYCAGEGDPREIWVYGRRGVVEFAGADGGDVGAEAVGGDQEAEGLTAES